MKPILKSILSSPRKRPVVWEAKVTAGQWNFGAAHPGRKWTFPPGTVQHSDGVTPVVVSNNDTVNVIIPAGGGIVCLEAPSWEGNYRLGRWLSINYAGDFASLPDLEGELNLTFQPAMRGDIKNIPPKATSLAVRALVSSNNVWGDLGTLQNYITGSMNFQDYYLVQGAFANVAGDLVPSITTLTNTGVSASDMDIMLIAYARCTKTAGTFTADNMTRTAASDAAVEHLTKAIGDGGLGWTITGITKV